MRRDEPGGEADGNAGSRKGIAGKQYCKIYIRPRRKNEFKVNNIQF